ncbi:MAG: hypothetical protein ACKV19_07875 [Verrucomicrobiales bacterium]
MNALTLDFIRRWRWLLVAQCAGTAIAWIWHGDQPRARIHLEMMAAMAMSWELIRGAVRAHLAVPQARAAITRGIWFSVVGIPVAIHWVAMLLGAAAALVFRLPVDPASLLLHAIFSPLVAGTMLYLLSSLPVRPARTFAGQIRDAVFGMLWGLSVFGTIFATVLAPVSKAEIGVPEALVMMVMAALSVASWFRAGEIVEDRSRAISKGTTAPAGPLRPVLLGRTSLMRAWLEMELRMQWVFSLIALLFAGIMLAMNQGIGAKSEGTRLPMEELGILFAMIAMPLMTFFASTLRGVRALPFSLTSLACSTALRPFLALLNVSLCLLLVNSLIRRQFSVGPEELAPVLFSGGLISIAQAVILRWPRLPVMMGTLMLGTSLAILAGRLPGAYSPSTVQLALMAALLLPISCWLHRRWIQRSSSLYRGNTLFTRFSGAAR